MKIRGTAQQIYEKYLSLARDAVSAGDRISAEGFFQFADHYYRLFNAANGNGQPRGDQNNRIPPPPESAAGGFVGGDDMPGMAAGDAEDDGPDADERHFNEGEPQRAESYPPQRPADEFRPMRPAEPIHRPRVVEPAADAAPAAQAEELAEALARGGESADADGPSEEGPELPAGLPAETADDNAAQPGRRTLGLNLGGRRTLGRRSQRTAEGETLADNGAADEAADVPSAESREGGFLGPKPIRRRVRRIAGITKPKEPAGTA